MILHGIEYQRPTSLNMRILADHVTYSFLAFMKSIFHFCLGCYCGGYSQNGRSNLSSLGVYHIWIKVLLQSKYKSNLEKKILVLMLEGYFALWMGHLLCTNVKQQRTTNDPFWKRKITNYKFSILLQLSPLKFDFCFASRSPDIDVTKTNLHFPAAVAMIDSTVLSK